MASSAPLNAQPAPALVAAPMSRPIHVPTTVQPATDSPSLSSAGKDRYTPTHETSSPTEKKATSVSDSRYKKSKLPWVLGTLSVTALLTAFGLWFFKDPGRLKHN
jgi:hypothetical protein